MKRKRYGVMFDEEKAEYVKAVLSKVNVTTSGFLETSIIALYDMLIDKGSVEKLSSADILEALHDLVGRIEAKH